MAQTNFTPILTYKSDTASSVPSAGNLTNSANGAELAVNTADKRLFTKDSGGNVVEVGTNPSSLTMPNGTANGVVYANGSKVLTSGSALTFDGTTFKAGSLWAQGAQGGELFINLNGTSNNYYNAGTHFFQAASGLSEYMRLTSTGLGIGTSSPSAKLHVVGANTSGKGQFVLSSASAGQEARMTFVDGSDDIAEISTDGNNLYFYTEQASGAFLWYTNGSERMRLDSAGNLGLGVTPSATDWNASATVLQVKKNDTNGGLFKASSSNTDFIFSAGNNLAYIATTTNTPITFFTNTTERARIDSSGNLLVGTTSTITSGKQTISYDGAVNGLVISESANTANTTFLAFNNGTSVIGSVYRVSSTSAVAYATTSDYRLKTVTGAVTGQGARIDALKPVDYIWTEGSQQARGFLAHEFQTVYPNSVSGTKDAVDADGNPKYQSMQASSSEVIADLIAEIQSLRQRLSAANL